MDLNTEKIEKNDEREKKKMRKREKVVGLSPMAGVTSEVFRRAICEVGSKPDIFFTEFVPVESIVPAGEKTLEALYYSEIERPIVAQFYGKTSKDFYKAVLIACYLGFDGIDINMGCSVKKVFSKGGGAGLIFQNELVKKIIFEAKRGIADFEEGKGLEVLDLPVRVLEKIAEIYKYREPKKEEEESFFKERLSKKFTLSIKTRLGIREKETEKWISFLISLEPDFISLHGRTVSQGYIGEADWEEIRKAGVLCREAGVLFLGNGDIKDLEEAERKIKDYGLDGVLIGRGVARNPFIFKNLSKFNTYRLQKKDILDFAWREGKLFGVLFPDGNFRDLRTHFSFYCREFEGAKDLRVKLLKVNNLEELESLLFS